MNIYCDDRRHLVCVPYSRENLHKMAAELGIKRCWYHTKPWPHYDIPKRWANAAQAQIEMMSSKDLVRLVNSDRLKQKSKSFHAFEWLRSVALEGNNHAVVLLEELIALNKLRFKVERPKGKCMSCGDPIDIHTAFALNTGLGICGKPACRAAFTDAGIV